MNVLKVFCRAVLTGLCLGVIACSEPADPEPDPEAAAQVGEPRPIPFTLPPLSAATPRYVGLWATTADGCSNPAWRFEERGVSTQGEVSCEFQRVEMTARGYDIQAQCTAESPPTPYNIQLSFAESARAMMITGGPWQSGTALVHCAPLPAP